MRVVSLLASATEIVCALGAGEMLVGRSHECDNPDWVASLPPCSEPAFNISVSSVEIDLEVKRRLRAGEPLYLLHDSLIRSLRPDLVISQIHCDVCAVTPDDVDRTGGSFRQLALTANSVESIFKSVLQVARALDREECGNHVVAEERARLRAVCERTRGLPRPRVAAIEWTDPLFSMGNWGPELVAFAGGDALIGRAEEFSVGITFAELQEADPDVIVVAPCGFTLERAWTERGVMKSYPGWGHLRAVRNGRVAFADGNRYFNRSGMTIARTAEILAEILHGEVFGAPSQGVDWRWIE